MSSHSAVPSTESVTSLLGMLAYGELVAFDRISRDARLAPDLARRASLSVMAAAEINNYRRLVVRITELDGDPEAVMRPFVEVIDEFHDSTAPRDWLEGLLKIYVGDGIADDFFREMAALLEPDDRDLVLDVLHNDTNARFAVAEINAAIAADPSAAGRMALWGRRLVAEALTQAQRVASEHDSLTAIVAEGHDNLEQVTALIKRITQAHAERMQAVGLNT